MTRHLASTRDFPVTYSHTHPWTPVSDAFRYRPCAGGELVIWPMPNSPDGNEPYCGMDPSAPATWVRPYNPQPGMVAQLNFDGAKLQAQTPMGGTWRVPMRDRQDVKRRWWRRGLPEDSASPSGEDAARQL